MKPEPYRSFDELPLVLSVPEMAAVLAFHGQSLMIWRAAKAFLHPDWDKAYNPEGKFNGMDSGTTAEKGGTMKQKNFFILPNDIFNIKMDAYEFLIYSYLVSCAGKSNICWPSLQTMSRMLGLSTNTIVRKIDSLIAKQLIDKENTTSKMKNSKTALQTIGIISGRLRTRGIHTSDSQKGENRAMDDKKKKYAYWTPFLVKEMEMR